MTDYNDGKWHGWNGGECPVHRKSRVDFLHENGFAWREMLAGGIVWKNCGAFRVTMPYVEPPKPREWWLVLNDSGACYGGYMLRGTAAKVCSGLPGGKIVHVREVLE
jgi:hypothetical protein